MKLNLENSIEWLYVFLFSIFLAYIGMAATMNYGLKHSFPYGFSASDAFGEIAYTEGIIDSGNHKFLPYYIRAGFTDNVPFHMPIFNHIAALFSLASGLPVWDSLLFIGYLFSIVGVLVMYIIIREFNRNIALISLPLSIFLYTGNFRIVYTWGSWDVVMATALLLSSVWALNKLELKFSCVLFAVLASGAALTHITEAFFLFAFTAVFLVLKAIRKRLELSEMKNLILAVILALLFSFYYLIIFKVGYAAGGVDTKIAYQAPEWFDVIISHFGLFRLVIFAGAIISLLLFLTKNYSTALLLGLFMLLIGYTNITPSFAPRALQTRYFWPIYLSVFLGVLVYFTLKPLIKFCHLRSKALFERNWKTAYSIFISLILAVSITYGYYQKSASSGIVTEYHWRSLLWIRDNTPKDAKILFFYGDPYTQEAVLWNQKRVSYRISMDDFVNAIKERKIKREYNVEVAAADDAGYLYRKSFFSFDYHVKDMNRSEFFGANDICKFNYFVFDKVSRQQALANYNLLVADRLLKSGAAEPVFNNEIVLILKNKSPRGNCIEEGSF